MSVMLNQDVLMGKWKQLRGRVKQQWGKLTDNQLDQISGRYEQLVGAVQASYGYTRQKAQEQVNAFVERVKQELDQRKPA